MNKKHYALIGLITPSWFLLVYLVMSTMRPEYSFLTKAISELGSLDAPNKWWWNSLGYMVTGLAITIFSFGLFNTISVDRKNKWSLVGMMGSGLLMAWSGIFPADMENRQSFTMVMHMAGSFGSYIFFLIGAFTLPKQMRKSAYWKQHIPVSLIIVWLTIVFGIWPVVFPSMPGAGQRITFFLYFLWIVNLAWRLYKYPTPIQTSLVKNKMEDK